MSKERQRDARRIEYWAGKKLHRTSSDIFYDRPRPANTYYLEGPNAICDQQYPIRGTIGDIGEGQASGLRSLDIGYLTRGYSMDPPVRRSACPGEIGWTITYFRQFAKPATKAKKMN